MRSLLRLLPLFLAPALLCAQDAAALFARGKEAFQRRDFDGAVAAFEKCVSANANDSRYQQWYGRALGMQAQRSGILKAMGSVGKIRAAMEKAIELDPNNLEARVDLFVFYMAAPSVAGGSKDKAKQQIEEIRRRDASLAAQLEGDLAASNKDLDGARAAYLKAARLGPSKPAPLVRLALLQQNEKDWNAAFGSLERALKIDSRNPAALYQMGRTGALSGQQLDRAESSLRTYLTLRPSFGDPPVAAAHFRLGMVLEKKGNAAGARAEYELALKLDPGQKEARAALDKLGRG